MHVNKIAVDLTELQIFKGPYLIIQTEVNDSQLSQLIKEYVNVKQSPLPPLKDLQSHFTSFAEKNKESVYPSTRDFEGESKYLLAAIDKMRVGLSMSHN